VTDDSICLNGINALTGEYLVAPMTVEEAGRRAEGANAPPAERAGWFRRLAKRVGQLFALPEDVDPNDLA
jgi:hypothetical protein